MLKIPIKSHAFPATISLPNELEFTKSKLLWSAITVGRPNKKSVQYYKQFSRFEMLYRWNMVQASLDFSDSDGFICNSSAFDNFDPSEIGAINFFLGMIVTKLSADVLLDSPWLIHASLFKKTGSYHLKEGRSCADLIGLKPSTNVWGIFEAKGRNSGISPKLISKAKKQAQNISTVNGASPWIRIAASVYRNKIDKRICFYWEDPPSDQTAPGAQLEADRETWFNYYAPIRQLVDEIQADQEGFDEQFGFRLELRDEIRRLLETVGVEGDGYRKPLEELRTWSSQDRDKQDDFWQGDGVGISITRNRITQ